MTLEISYCFEKYFFQVSARNRINDVAQVVANFIDFLVFNDFTHMTDISVIGHSLGGHTAGITGKRVKYGKIQTIIALDPAGPLFSTGARDERVNENDG
jgi:pancreatic triacylglycerol lipase